MIKKITFQNYKAFRNGELEIKPITVLLGTNSSGKSSLLQLLFLVTQGFSNQQIQKGAFNINNKFVTLGENRNILFRKNTRNNLKISIDIAEDTINKGSLIRNFGKHIMFGYLSEIEDKGHDVSFDPFNLYVARKTDNLLDTVIKLDREISPVSSISKNYKKAIKEAVEFLQRLIKANNNLTITSINYDFKYDKKSNDILVKSIELMSGELQLFFFSKWNNQGRKSWSLTSDIFPQDSLNDIRREFGRSHDFKGLMLRQVTEINKGNALLNFISEMHEELFDSISSYFSSQYPISYVSPLRAYPQRYYLIDQSYMTSAIDTKEGNSLADILKRNKGLKKKVNEWLSRFDIGIDIKEVNNVIHSIKVDQTGLSLDMVDVGFGISQVLPVIVQSLVTADETITVIEQPEIHLHPKMQAELADLFLDVISDTDKKLVIETHSEALLRRLRRRIAEDKVSSSDVCIYYVSNEVKLGSKIEKKELTKKGEFEWPKAFSEVELEDTVAFIDSVS